MAKEMTKNEILEEIKFNINQILKEQMPSSFRVPLRKAIYDVIDYHKDTSN